MWQLWLAESLWELRGLWELQAQSVGPPPGPVREKELRLRACVCTRVRADTASACVQPVPASLPAELCEQAESVRQAEIVVGLEEEVRYALLRSVRRLPPDHSSACRAEHRTE